MSDAPTQLSTEMSIAPNDLSARIELYLDDAPMYGGHSDRAGGTCWELLREAMEELRAPAQGSPERGDNDYIISQHIGWLKQYVEGMTEANWQDMRLHAERQLSEISRDLDAKQPTQGGDKGDLANEIDAAFNRFLYAKEGGQEWLNAKEALRGVLWDNKAGIIAYLKGAGDPAYTPIVVTDEMVESGLAAWMVCESGPTRRIVRTILEGALYAMSSTTQNSAED